MGIELLAVAGVLLLGGGLTILIMSLRSQRALRRSTRSAPTGTSPSRSAARKRRLVVRSTRWPGASETPPQGGSAASARPRCARSSSPQECTGRRRARSSGTRSSAAIFLTLLALWGIPLLGYSFVLAIVGAIAGGPVGWFLPMVYVDRTMRQRFEKIDRQMPDMIDLLVVTIEAGLGILASMRVASERLQDPLGQELRLTLQEQRMGLSVFEAITSLGQRADTPNMRMFVRSLTQGEKLGVSIATTMRNLATEMRKRRKAVAEEKAQKMPIKLLFPLVFLIFPAIMIVLLVPAMIHISEVL